MDDKENSILDDKCCDNVFSENYEISKLYANKHVDYFPELIEKFCKFTVDF